MMKKTFTGKLVSYTNQTNVVQQIKQGIAGDVLARDRCCDHLARSSGLLVGVISRRDGGQGIGPVDHGPRADRDLDAGLLARHHRALLPRGRRARPPSSPTVATSRSSSNPAQWFVAPDSPLDRARRALHRLLRHGSCASNILDTINEDYVRTARAKGISPADVLMQARPAQLVDPDRHAVRPRLRGGARRRRDPHRDRLRPARCRPVRGAVDRQLRPAADHRRHAVRSVLHRLLQRPGRPRLRVPRPADPAVANG